MTELQDRGEIVVERGRLGDFEEVFEVESGKLRLGEGVLKKFSAKDVSARLPAGDESVLGKPELSKERLKTREQGSTSGESSRSIAARV